MTESDRDDTIETEAAGETVGEAKWTALRQLEQRFPGLDKSVVEFVVVSEGERGLLGVGFVPARVIARVQGPVARQTASHAPTGPLEPPAQPPGSLTPAGEQLRGVLEHLRDALGLDASVSISETGTELIGTFHGRDLGLAIGKRGQTIDAIQTIAGLAIARATGDGVRLEVVVDAAGYRDRRRASLEQLADRAASRAEETGRVVDLEPMSASERKIVHLRLRDRPGVTTASDGADPNRHVVVQPAE